ncbi:MAG: AbrB/MazE/SpoVT family DNA-binding domain-containing protein [Nanoarchaeota archaeon]|nr:AbrB/MazE/SpoVT family DNA-binding domain-containing protein [Nanoarchaeota archaeon]
MSKRKFDVKLRKVGNSYVVTIPKDTVDRFNLNERDYLSIELDTDDIKRSKLDSGKNKGGDK